MDVNQISSFIATLGFPVAACAWLLYTSQKDKIMLYDKLDSYSKVLQDSTNTLERVNERLDRIENKLNRGEF